MTKSNEKTVITHFIDAS